jgi:hypothetical protein
MVEMSFGLERQDAVRITPKDGAQGSVTVSVAGQQTIEITVAMSATANRLLLLADKNASLAVAELQLGGSGSTDRKNVLVVPVDGVNRAIFGVGDQGVHAEVAGMEGIVKVSTLDPQILLLQALAAGETKVRVTQLGATSDIGVMVR